MEGPARPPAAEDSTKVAFTGAKADISSALATATVGLVSKDEFQWRREELEKVAEAEQSVPGAKKKKKKKKATSTLSFADDEEAEEEGAEAAGPSKRPKKNPNVDTSMLPDREREEAAQRRKEELAREWSAEQDAIKAEMLEVTYSYHTPEGSKDGQKGHRNTVAIPKGFTVQQFLNKCREQVKELRNASPDQLMYVKEDLILPHGTTFYELIVNKARGKSGPLFNFDVHEDVRMVNDARVEKDESHPGKVMEKRVYERHREKFPYSRFEVYDPAKKWDSYSIHGSETFGTGVNTALI